MAAEKEADKQKQMSAQKTAADEAAAAVKASHDAEIAKALANSEEARLKAEAAAKAAILQQKIDGDAIRAAAEAKHHTQLLEAQKKVDDDHRATIIRLNEFNDREASARREREKRHDLMQMLGTPSAEHVGQLMPAMLTMLGGGEPAASARPLLLPPPPADAPGAPLLPPGWEQVTDDQGRVYYQNLATSTTQWTLPVAQYQASHVLPPPAGEPDQPDF